MNKAITLALTGASGAPYALRLLECLVQADYRVFLLASSCLPLFKLNFFTMYDF